jgi:hypothetical protein
MGSQTESVIQFAPAARSAGADGVNQLDKAGQMILELLHKAAGVAEANSQHAIEKAQKISHQLRAAEDRIAELEAEVGVYQEKAQRAEQWLHTVYTDDVILACGHSQLSPGHSDWLGLLLFEAEVPRTRGSDDRSVGHQALPCGGVEAARWMAINR